MIHTLRPHQWLKNVLIALPAIAAHRFNEPKILIAFVSFSLMASSIYLLNDLVDVSHDRKHPRKRNRAIASGRVSSRQAAVAGIVLATISYGLCFFLPPYFALVLSIYIIVAMAYCFLLKNIMMLDVVVLAMLYGVRVLAGAEAVAVPLSHWLIGFCFFLFLCLALVKRTNDIEQVGGRPYRPADLTTMIALMCSSAFVSVLMFALYLNDVPPLYRRPELLWGICVLLVFWLGRMCLLAGRAEMHDDPVVFAATDNVSLATGVATVAIFLCAL